MSSRKPQSISSLGIDNAGTSSQPAAPRRVRSHRGDSSHSRSSLGSLDDINESEDPSLARARDRIRRTAPNTPLSSSMSSLPRSKRHSNEDAPTATSSENATEVLSTDEAASRRGSRRRVPRATRSNDSLGAMSASVSSFQASDNNISSSRIAQRSRRTPPARSKSSDDSISLIPLDNDNTPINTNRTRTSDSATATSNDNNNNNNNNNIARATTTKPTDERGRSATTKPRSSSRSRSRSKSKGARKRPNARAAQIVASANSGTSKRDSTESNKDSSTVTTTTISTSTRTRRKPGDGNNSLSGLSLLDNLAPRIGPRDAKSVDVELLSPPSRSKLPQRKLDRGLGDSGISSLALFLNNTKSPKSNKISSSRSVGAMPTTNTSLSGASALSSKKPLRRRLRKKDDESLASVSSKRSSSKSKSKGHSSLGSGLDLHTASNAPMESYGTNSKMRGRKTKSKASSDDSSIREGSLHVSDILGTNSNNKNGGSNNNRHSGGGSSTITNNNNNKPMERLNRSMGDIAFKASDLGSLLAQQKELKRRTGGGGASVVSELVVEDEPPPQEDIFSMYSWTTSRQVRHKVQQERKLLNSTLRQGSFQKAFELYVGHQSATT